MSCMRFSLPKYTNDKVSLIIKRHTVRDKRCYSYFPIFQNIRFNQPVPDVRRDR